MDPKKLVVLADSVRSAKRAGLDLADTGRDGKIRNRAVFGLTASMAYDGRPAGSLGHINCFECLR